MPETIAFSLISHTNAGKTTLARTLLGRDIGEVRDEAHVTDTTERHVLVESPQGDRLVLWDTPGFGDSARLLKRLRLSDDPIGRLLGEVWDRFRDRPLYSSQLAARNVRDEADVVLYLVNASELPAEAGYVDPEIELLDWIGKPVVVLLNQLGKPQPVETERAELTAWREHLSSSAQVRAVLPLDAFARCWVQEAVLLRAIAPLVAEPRRAAYERLVDAWLAQRRRVFDESMAVLAESLARTAVDSEPLEDASVFDRVREVGSGVLGGLGSLAGGSSNAGRQTPDAGTISAQRQQAMASLATRLDAAIRTTTDQLIAVHGLEGNAAQEILSRMAEHYDVHQQLHEGKAAAWGGALTGALAGLKADLATGGLSFGAGMLAGGVIGALGGFGLARGYNVVRGARSSSITWSTTALDELVAAALLTYLAVAHYGRGRGDWTASEYPPHWRAAAEAVVKERRDALSRAWSRRSGDHAGEAVRAALEPQLGAAALELLQRLYPGAETFRASAT